MLDGQSLVELRGDIPRELIDVIDAVAMAEKSNRMTVVRKILGEWVEEQVHRSTLILRIRRGNGNAAESSRSPAE